MAGTPVWTGSIHLQLSTGFVLGAPIVFSVMGRPGAPSACAQCGRKFAFWGLRWTISRALCTTLYLRVYCTLPTHSAGQNLDIGGEVQPAISWPPGHLPTIIQRGQKIAFRLAAAGISSPLPGTVFQAVAYDNPAQAKTWICSPLPATAYRHLPTKEYDAGKNSS